MILNDLFESGMSRILDTMREVKTLSDDEFIKAHDMSKHMWVRTNWPVIKSVASYDSEIKKHLRKPIGDEHLFRGTAVSPTVHEGATVAYVVTYFDTKTGDRGESTVSALTQQDAKDQIVDLMHERGYDVVVTGVRSAVNEFAPGNGGDDDSNDLTPEAYNDGQRLGFSSVDGMPVIRAFGYSNWDEKYFTSFAQGWIAGRRAKIKHAQRDGVELELQKDGTLVRSSQGVAEDWKGPAAALATVGALATGVAMNPDMDFDGQRYEKTTQHALSNAPADAKTVTKDGKTYKVWTVPAGKHGHDRKGVYAEINEADETSWTANSAQFRKEEDMSWTVEVTLEPQADINQGRGTQQKTMTVTSPSRDAAKKKLVDYFRKNGWAVTGIKFAGDLGEETDHPFDRGMEDARAGKEYNDSQYKNYQDKESYRRGRIVYRQKAKQGVAEGSQTFGKHDPYWVCVNGKKWKRFDTYEHARAVHDRLEKKLRSEGSDKKVSLLADDQLDEKQDACYNKVKSRYKVWPSAYASGALVQCRKKGAANWGNKSKK